MLAALAIAAMLLVPPAVDSPSLAAIERETTALFERVAPSVVLIRTPDGLGSGFFVSGLGHIVTNRHVVGNRNKVKVALHDGRELIGTVAERGSGGVDVAMVKISAKGTPALSLADTRGLRIGSWAGSVGHGHGGVWTLTSGFVSNAHGDRDHGVLQTQIPLNPGASGGPVFDRRGRVVGIVVSGLVDSDAINFAITPETALRGLSSLCRLTNCLRIEAPEGASVFVDGTRIGTGPRLHVVAKPRRYRIEADVGGKRVRRSAEFPDVRSVKLGPSRPPI